MTYIKTRRLKKVVKAKSYWLAALCVLFLAGCTTPPKPTWFSKSMYQLSTLEHRLSKECRSCNKGEECEECTHCKPCPPDVISEKTHHFSSMMDGFNVRKTAEHCAYRALKAYRKETDECLTEEFEEGFVQAYLEVADGYSGETPAVPSPKYWHAMYRTPEGHTRVQHWFEGYRYGAINATRDGLGKNTVATSVNTPGDYGPFVQPECQQCQQREYSQEDQSQPNHRWNQNQFGPNND